jgi:hypothetical protein
VGNRWSVSRLLLAFEFQEGLLKGEKKRH